jgi:diphthamide synthase subunit DPH2
MSKGATMLRRDPSAEEPNGRSRVLVLVDAPEHDEIAALAYQLWIGRGCPEGSPDQDWFCAEKILQPYGS